MDTGRTPACIAEPFAGEGNTSASHETNIGEDNIKATEDMQSLVAIKGNRCGHDKNNFKKPKPIKDHRKRPHCLEEAKRRIYQSIDNNFRYSEGFAALFFHKAGSIHKNGSTRARGRKRRTESIEGVFSLALPILLHHLNLHRMACGFYDHNNNFRAQDFFFLKDRTDQSSIRIKREMALLQREGIIKVNTKRKMLNDGSWVTIDVEIEFTDKIFHMLDLMPEFERDRERAAAKFYESQKRLDRNREKRQMFRKPSFSTKPHNKKPTPALNDISSLTRKLINPYTAPSRGRGQEINDLYNRCRSQGYTAEKAAEIVKKKYPPPN